MSVRESVLTVQDFSIRLDEKKSDITISKEESIGSMKRCDEQGKSGIDSLNAAMHHLRENHRVSSE